MVNNHPWESLKPAEILGKLALLVQPSMIKKTDSYAISGSGENMWFKKDAFHYVWKKVSGDVSLSTRIAWEGKGVNPYRKAGVIIRQNLNASSSYADAIVHDDGLTSLQYREKENGLAH